MQALVIGAVTLVFVLAQAAPRAPVADASARLLIVFCATLAAPLYAWFLAGLAQARAASGDPATRAAAVLLWRRWKMAHAALWVGSLALIYCGAQWGRLTAVNWGLADAPLLDDLALMAPLAASLVLSWLAWHDGEQAVAGRGGEAGASDESPSSSRMSSTRAAAAAWGPRWRYAATQAALTLGLTLPPLFLLAGAHDVLRLYLPAWQDGPLAWCVYGPIVAALVLALPLGLRILLRSEPLPAGPLRRRLEAAAARAGLRCRDLLLWKTDGRMLNAAVAGFAPGLRYVFFTDALLARLTSAEIEAVLLHEAGHVRRGHLWLRLLAVTLPAWLGFAAARCLPEATKLLSQTLAAWGVSPTAQVEVLAPLAAAAAAFGLLAWWSRRLEFDADLWAARQTLVGDIPAEPNTPADLATALPGASAAGGASAAAALASALLEIARGAGHDPRRETWLHPSVARRVALLRLVAAEPLAAARAQRRVALGLGWALGVALLGAAAFLG